ncbi:TOBE domain-containing protein [Acidovorax lacteus]|uniref:Mop domain-containing protein n=1 Tax=Acidovorax lacteus TaxID=1924988 RepID=A0ABP8L5V1_9BURK
MDERLHLRDALGLDVADKRIAILRRIADCGSISQAARDAGVSYKAAWQAVDTLTNLAGVPLLDRVVGGSGGGGARLTDAGRSLLEAAQTLDTARSALLTQWQGPQAGLRTLARLALRTSMRNQLPCTVETVEASGALVRVGLRLSPLAGNSPGDRIWSRITRESAELLALQPGLAVQALCKATAVRVLAASGAACADAALQGTAQRVARGDWGDEVVAQLAGGLQLVGFAPAHSGLRARRRVALLVDESAWVIARAGD